MAEEERQPGQERQRLDLFQSAQTLVEECRMVLPGIQAIFGFQLVAVTNTRFTELEDWEQWLHLGATAMVALSAAIVMAPAAIHRANGGREVSDAFIRTSSLLVLAAMTPLALGLAIDFYLISRLVDMAKTGLDVGLAAILFALLFFIWMVFPRMRWLHALLGRTGRGA